MSYMKAKRETWTIEPDDDVKSLMDKAITRKVGKGGSSRGLRTRIIEEALRAQLANLRGKREGI